MTKLTGLQIERLRMPGRHPAGEGLYLQVCQFASNRDPLFAPNRDPCAYQILHPTVFMVKAAEDRSRDNLAEPLDRPLARRIFGDGQMCPYPIVVGSISRENPAQMDLAEDDDVIEAFPADRAD